MKSSEVLIFLLTIHRIQLTRSVDETSFVVAYVNVCGKQMLMRFFLFDTMF